MKIFNVEEHLDCYCYDSGLYPLIEVRKFKLLEFGDIALSSNEIVFVLKGKLRFSMHDFSTEISHGHFVLLPATHKIHYKAFLKSTIMILRLNEDMQLCPTFNLDRLNKKQKSVERPPGFTVLEINIRIRHYISGLLSTLKDGLKCRYFFQAKITELLIMLRVFYSEEQQSSFFYYFFTTDAGFAEYVRSNHLRYATVNEFAVAMEMTPQQFARRFYSLFGENPYEWMQREKARLVYRDICRTNKPLKDIADKYGFHIQANFSRFCKAAFGMNPGEIRKKRLVID